MANTLYTKAKEKILSGEIDFITDTIKVSLVENTYPQNIATDEFYDDISAYVLSTDQTLTAKSISGGLLDGGDVTYPAVTAGDTSEGVVIWKDTGNPATSPLLLYIDTIGGFPLLTNGGDITVAWSSGANKIFSL